MQYLTTIGNWITPYFPEISIALIACCLVMFGNEINKWVRKTLRGQNFVVRTTVFVLINAFGYGLLIVKASPILASWLRSLEYSISLPLIIFIFVAIGVWAQKHKHV